MSSALLSLLSVVVGLNFSAAPCSERTLCRWDDSRPEHHQNAVPDVLSAIEPGELPARIRRVDFTDLFKRSQPITRETAEIQSHASGLVHGCWQRLARIPGARLLDSRSLPLEI